MNKIMKKLSLLVLTLGVMAAVKAPAFANDYVSSTWTALFIQYVSTATDPSKITIAVGGVTAGGTADLTRVYLSSGYANGAYLVCIDSLPLTAQTGGTPSYVANFGAFAHEQYLFPPQPFIPSTSTVTGATQIVDFRDMQGGGRTIKNGLSCYVNGDTVNRYWYTIETVETPSAHERR